MGCASSQTGRTASKTQCSVAKLQRAWDEHLCAEVLPRAAPCSKSSRRRLKPKITFGMQPFTSDVVEIDLQPEEVLKWTDSEETLFIFDWDDTLFPNSWVKEQKGKNLDEAEAARIRKDNEEDVRELSSQVVELLRAAQKLGKVVFVTNSRPGWVERCCDRLMPETKAIVAGIPVFYAREYLNVDEQVGPRTRDLLTQAKARAMSVALLSGHEIGKDSKRWKNIVSIGDGCAEREAIQQVAKQVRYSTLASDDCCTKAIKLADKPSLDLLIVQLSMLSTWLEGVTHCAGKTV